MSIGARVRRSLGRLERPASDVYRSFFLDTRELASIIGSLEPTDRILEVGVGEFDGQTSTTVEVHDGEDDRR